MTDTLSPLRLNDLLGCPQPERDNVTSAERQAWRPVTRDEAIKQRDIWLKEKVKAERRFGYWQAVLNQM